MDRPVVELDDAVAVLGSFPALAGASLTVQRGEIVLLRGPNGAGKTTLLRVCAGLVPLARGDRHRARLRPRHRARRGAPAGRPARPPQRPVPRPDGGRERALLGGHGRRQRRRDRGGAWTASGSAGRLAAAARSGACRPGSSGAPRWPAWWPGGPSCGCSTSRTPASTPTGRDDLDATLRQAAASGATVMVASHELERAGSLATRVRRRRRRPGRESGTADRAATMRTALADGRARTCASSGAAASSSTRSCPFAAHRDGAVRLRHRPPAPRR